MSKKMLLINLKVNQNIYKYSRRVITIESI